MIKKNLGLWGIISKNITIKKEQTGLSNEHFKGYSTQHPDLYSMVLFLFFYPPT